MLIKIKKNILREFFYFLSAVLLLCIGLEIIWPNSVLSYLNVNYLIILWVLSWLVLI
jgi:hypothetical protein